MNYDHKYDDIIHLSRPASPRRARMSMVDRGAQFSPFAALTGYDAAIRETARLTLSRIELTESEKLRLNETLQPLLERLEHKPAASVTWFRPDERKEGGEYVTETVRIARPDPYGRGLLLTDGRMLLFEDILALEEV